MMHDSLDTVMRTQPLGTVFRSGGAIPLIGQSEDSMLYGIPWLQDWDTLSFEGRADPNGLVVAHAPLYRGGYEGFGEGVSLDRWATLQGSGSCYYGHVHVPHGIYSHGNVTFSNQGSVCRTACAEDSERGIDVTVWDKGTFSAVPLSTRPLTELLCKSVKLKAGKAVSSFEEFFSQATSATLGGPASTIAGILEEARSMGTVSVKALKIVEELLDEAA